MRSLLVLTLATFAMAHPMPLSAQAPPAGVTERELTVPGPVPLGGTLTLPAGKGPFPAVIIVHGSGAIDRDLTYGPNAPYRDIAWGLAAQGVAVLRYDKRPKVQPAWFGGRAFTVRDEVTDDALQALTLLRAQPEVDRRRTMLIGHSLGGMLAPRIAAADPQLAGIILMAGATLTPLQDQIERQLAYLEAQGGDLAAAVAQQRPAVSQMATAIRKLTAADSADLRPLLGAPAAYYLDLKTYDAAATARALRIPILVLQGMRDYQVTPAQLDDWLTAFGDPGSRLTVRRYPSLNHFFISGSGAAVPAEYGSPGHVAAEVIADIATFVKKN